MYRPGDGVDIDNHLECRVITHTFVANFDFGYGVWAIINAAQFLVNGEQ